MAVTVENLQDPGILESHAGPWTGGDLNALPESGRYEIIEGSLLVNPPAISRHQRASYKLAAALETCVPTGLIVVEATGVSVPGGSYLIPDILVAEREAALADHSGLLDPRVVRLVVEIVSPGSRTMDRVTKLALYAQAGIPSFWRIELDEDPTGPAVVAYHLEGGGYVEVASAQAGGRLEVTDPFAVAFDPAELRP